MKALSVVEAILRNRYPYFAEIRDGVALRSKLGAMLLTWNNLAYYQSLMAGIRAAIAEGRYDDFRRKVKAGWAAGEAGRPD